MNEILFGYKPTIMGIVVKKMMNMWVEEICNNFIDINQKILEST